MDPASVPGMGSQPWVPMWVPRHHSSLGITPSMLYF